MILSDVDIKKFMSSSDIEIEDFSGDIEPASYDLRVGSNGISSKGVINIKEKKFIKIPRGSTAVIYPCERIKLSNKITARYGLRSKFARRGLILLSGPQIDPGFEGTLSVTIFNAGTDYVRIDYQEKFATIEFMELSSPASRGYSGPYQKQDILTGEDIDLMTRKYKNFAQIESVLQKTSIHVTIIKDLLYVVIFGLIVGIAVALIQLYLN
ncbi:MAG: dCTP deaminase [Sedimentisphaerales bacterium]|nr:dCTP deaminase [Sedimentisphaerales bacterium]